MDNENQSAIIQIQSIEPSPYGVKIAAQDKKIYNVSKTKKDGTMTVAWQQMGDMGLKGIDPITGTPGATVEIWYREVPNKHGGTSRYISSFKETNGTPTVQSSSQPQKAGQGQNLKPSEPSRDDFSRRLGIQGHLNALLSNHALCPEHSTASLVKWAIEIEDELEKQLNPSPFRQAVQRTNPDFLKEHDLPTIQQDPTAEEPTFTDDELDSIPF